MTGRHLLIVEDDNEIRELLLAFLGREGYSAVGCADAQAMDTALRYARPDLIVLDLMLPGEDGFSICRRLQATAVAPILMLTARGDDMDRILGLEMGADDYLAKPFSPRELLARIRAILRRHGGGELVAAPRRCYAFHRFTADLDRRSVTTDGGCPLRLTSAEFDLLACFVRHPRRTLSRERLLDWTRGREGMPWDRTIDVMVSRLRRQLSAACPDAGALITTVRSGGYRLDADVQVIRA